MEFPYGKAPLAIALIALAASVWLLGVQTVERRNIIKRPDLVYATFVKEHAEAYGPAIAQFEKDNNCTIQIQVVDQKALQDRLQSALQAGADVPDMVELMFGTIGVFTKGPIEDVGFIDLTDRIKETGLDQRVVARRFVKWSSRGHIFALPHDMHPVMLVYRRDVVEQLGIDVSKLTTWDEFCRVGRKVVHDSTGADGIPRHYMLDLPSDGNDYLAVLLLQRGGGLFDSSGNATFDSEKAVDVVEWYVKQIHGKDQIAFPAGQGQSLYMAMNDATCLFHLCPDWQAKQFEADVPSLSGKLSLMPLPAWEPGGIRTSTWGGTGLAFTKQCHNFDLAWKLAMYLYYDPDQLGPRFAATHILPPLKAAWNRPEFYAKAAYFSGLPFGRVYAALAPDVPAENDSAYANQAISKMSEAMTNASAYYAAHGDDGLRDFVRRELKIRADRIRVMVNRNVFLRNSVAVEAK